MNGFGLYIIPNPQNCTNIVVINAIAFDDVKAPRYCGKSDPDCIRMPHEKA
jgi:hypothetical protein